MGDLGLGPAGLATGLPTEHRAESREDEVAEEPAGQGGEADLERADPAYLARRGAGQSQRGQALFPRRGPEADHLPEQGERRDADQQQGEQVAAPDPAVGDQVADLLLAHGRSGA